MSIKTVERFERRRTDNELSVKPTPTKPPFKKELCLDQLLTLGVSGLNQLEAFSAYVETCLHTVIAQLANDHDLLFHRQREQHTHRAGGKTYFTRYRLVDPHSIILAHGLVEQSKVKIEKGLHNNG
jgi:hypothetical protein